MVVAFIEFGEALKIFRELAQKNSDIYLPSVAQTLNNLGYLDRARNRVEEARNEYAEALDIYETLAKKNPQKFSLDVTEERNLLGELAK
jgi:tetratricopeptide (TPR) repeat protein